MLFTGHKLNLILDAQTSTSLCLPLTKTSLGPTELAHHLCYDRAHLGIRLVLGEVGRIVHHCNQGLKASSQINQHVCNRLTTNKPYKHYLF
jgi:hypothetical protein